MKEFWDSRYRQETFAYGQIPNAYFKEKLGDFTAGNILLPAEGEGRNAVYAARQGWNVFAFDLSEEGKKKALRLADGHGVGLDYSVGDLSQMDYAPELFDLIGLIYAHFPQALRSAYHKKIAGWLKKGGVLVLEAFGKKHLDYVTKNEAVGGPKDPGLLYSLEEIKRDFEGFEFLELKEEEVELNEGLYHVGLGWVIRALIRRPS
jgi:2-polyprenyl-3-methyl-5-hydroxy-6-metoxy-1,4-benzoquinol methylase